jgi:ribulose 1,5-bisphosphate synthetase/thiazole synthase
MGAAQKTAAKIGRHTKGSGPDITVMRSQLGRVRGTGAAHAGSYDVVVVGAGGAGLRATLGMAEPA